MIWLAILLWLAVAALAVNGVLLDRDSGQPPASDDDDDDPTTLHAW